MKIRPARIAVATALGLGLALAPVAANAATPAPAASVSATIASPVDQTTYEQQLNLYYTIQQRGSATYTMQLSALPGAKVTVIVNGRVTSTTADASGVARVKVTMVHGQNSVSVQQAKGSARSELRSFGYQY